MYRRDEAQQSETPPPAGCVPATASTAVGAAEEDDIEAIEADKDDEEAPSFRCSA